MKNSTFARALLFAAALFAAAAVPAVTHAATIQIINNDGAGEGFNDPTPVAPIGGNPGTTLGQQRLFAFQYAADLWGQCLSSDIVIEVEAQMDPQYCGATGAVLGSAGTFYVHADFPGAPKAATWYPQALANALAGMDLHPGTPEIGATFNSNLNGNASCLGGIGWYYGIDQNPGGDIDFVTVVAHEIGHGLGFQTFMSSSGFLHMDLPDTYFCHMYHVGSAPPDYPSMTEPQRAACNIGDPDLVWNGPNVNATVITIPVTGGTTGGYARLHGPNPFQGGSSLAHWSPALTPNQLMEPAYTGPNHNIADALEIQLMKDIGWVLLPKGPVGTPEGTPTAYGLNQNHPNPFNPTTTISYQIGEAGRVTLKVYNVAGRLVRTLVDGREDRGAHEVQWDGRDSGGSPVSSGVYFYTIKASSFVQTKRMVLLK